MTRRPSLFIQSALAFVALSCWTAAARPQPPGPGDAEGTGPRLWISTSRTAAGLAIELSSLYEALAEKGRMPQRLLKDEEGRQLVEIFKDERLYFNDFNDRMKALACRLNSPSHCQTSPPESGEEQDYDWTNRAGDWVVVPDLDLEVVTSTWLYDRTAGDDLRGLVTELGVCRDLDEACREKIREINAEDVDVLAPDFQGPMWLPMMQVRIWLDLSSDRALERALERNLVPRVDLPQTGADAPEHDTESWAPPPPPPSRGPSALSTKSDSTSGDPTVEAGEPDVYAISFEPRMPPPAAVPVEPAPPPHGPSRAKSAAPNCGPLADPAVEHERRLLAERQETVMELIGLPAEAELAARHALGPDRDAPRVVMIDTQLDSHHCGFDRALVRAFDHVGASLAIAAGGREDCGTPLFANDWDHGTHVAGLIAARPNSATNAVLRGVNPRVQLDAYEKPPGEGNLEIRKRWLLETRTLLDEAVKAIPKVINLSLGYETRGLAKNDLVKTKLRDLIPYTLVVIAAGNKGLEHGLHACPPSPACFDLPNVLVVGALDLDDEEPAIWTDSDGHTSDVGSRVHLAAPGSEIPSLVRGNAIGALSGTSHAAPMVTGAATLLYDRTKSRNLPPYRIRNRLIYTSDFFPHLYDMLLGGRLNVDRALDIDRATFVLKHKALLKCREGIRELPEGGVLKGRIIRTASADDTSRSLDFAVIPEKTIVFKNTDRSRPVPLLKRMIALHEPREYLLFIGPEGENTELERIKVTLNSPNRWVWLDLSLAAPPAGPWPAPLPSEVCGFEMRYIKDYVAAIPHSPAAGDKKPEEI